MNRTLRFAVGALLLSLVAGAAAAAVAVMRSYQLQHPQRGIAAQAASFVSRGYSPAAVVAGPPVEVGSGTTWVVITDAAGRAVASSARDGGQPVSLASCREDAGSHPSCFFVPGSQVPQNLSVELPSGSRQSLHVVPLSGDVSGYVFAGRRTPAFAHQRLAGTLRLVAATWLLGIVALFAATRLSRR